MVVIWPDAGRVGSRHKRVCERFARLDVCAWSRESRNEGAVRPDAIVNAVEVHRMRHRRVEIPEVDDDLVTDSRPDRGTRDPVVVTAHAGLVLELTPESRRERLVDDGVERR